MCNGVWCSTKGEGFSAGQVVYGKLLSCMGKALLLVKKRGPQALLNDMPSGHTKFRPERMKERGTPGHCLDSHFILLRHWFGVDEANSHLTCRHPCCLAHCLAAWKPSTARMDNGMQPTACRRCSRTHPVHAGGSPAVTHLTGKGCCQVSPGGDGYSLGAVLPAMDEHDMSQRLEKAPCICSLSFDIPRTSKDNRSQRARAKPRHQYRGPTRPELDAAVPVDGLPVPAHARNCLKTWSAWLGTCVCRKRSGRARLAHVAVATSPAGPAQGEYRCRRGRERRPDGTRARGPAA